MIWVIEKYSKHGDWLFARHADGQPMWFPTRAKAQIALRGLPRGRYRITKVAN